MSGVLHIELTSAAPSDRNIHIVSLVHALTVIVLASRALRRPELSADKVLGWHATAEIANSVAAGYVLLRYNLMQVVSFDGCTLGIFCGIR